MIYHCAIPQLFCSWATSQLQKWAGIEVNCADRVYE